MSVPEPYVPEDFDDFWRETVEEAGQVRLDFRRSLTNCFDLPGFTVETIDFAVTYGRRLNGWIAYPTGARRLPSFLWIPPYGRESMLPNEYGTREGFASMSFNFFGLDSFYQEKYVPERGYFAEGAESPGTWVFRTMFKDSLIALRVLQAQIEADEDRIGAMGMSQGGGMAIWLGAWSQIIKSVCADMPFLAGIRQTLQGAVYRYPLKELTEFMPTIPVGEARVLHTVSYFDTINHATRCLKPTHVSLGLRDPAARPENVRGVYHALTRKKSLSTYEIGHDWHPDMVENNRRWLLDSMDDANQ